MKYSVQCKTCSSLYMLSTLTMRHKYFIIGLVVLISFKTNASPIDDLKIEERLDDEIDESYQQKISDNQDLAIHYMDENEGTQNAPMGKDTRSLNGQMIPIPARFIPKVKLYHDPKFRENVDVGDIPVMVDYANKVLKRPSLVTSIELEMVGIEELDEVITSDNAM